MRFTVEINTFDIEGPNGHDFEDLGGDIDGIIDGLADDLRDHIADWSPEAGYVECPCCNSSSGDWEISVGDVRVAAT